MFVVCILCDGCRGVLAFVVDDCLLLVDRCLLFVCCLLYHGVCFRFFFCFLCVRMFACFVCWFSFDVYCVLCGVC